MNFLNFSSVKILQKVNKIFSTPSSEKDERAESVKSEPESVTSDDIKKEDLIEPEKFSDVNEVRRAISLSNIWKVNFSF